MASTKTIPKPDLRRLRLLAEEAAPHVERLTETLAVARHESEALLEIVQTYICSMPGGVRCNDVYALDPGAYLDVDGLRPALFLLKECLSRHASLHDLAGRTSTFPRQTLYTPNGRH